MSRKPLGVILAALFGVLALTDWVQVLLFLVGRSDAPATLIALHAGTGTAAAATWWGSRRGMRWTPIAAVAYGVLATVLLVALPSLIDLPVDARAGLRTGAAAVLLFALLGAAYFRAEVRQRARALDGAR